VFYISSAFNNGGSPSIGVEYSKVTMIGMFYLTSFNQPIAR
jgi:hypothetical protein